jgi:hypothetical protein
MEESLFIKWFALYALTGVKEGRKGETHVHARLAEPSRAWHGEAMGTTCT